MGHTRIISNPLMTRFLVEALGAFIEDPLVICDVGARGGLEKQWQVFGSQAMFIGFEPDPAECERLNQFYVTAVNDSTDGATPVCRFYPVALGKQREQRSFSICHYPGGSSFYPADLNFIQRFPAEHAQHLAVMKTITLETISLDEFTQEQNLPALDFIKLDVEGSELDILQGSQALLCDSVLGISLEVLFHETMRHQPVFSDIDRFLQDLGFQLFDLDLYRHARRTLNFPMGPLGNTPIGQVLWGQALYLRDAMPVLQQPDQVETDWWTQTRILKLASLMEIFQLPDCALELLQTATKRLALSITPLEERLKTPYLKQHTHPLNAERYSL